MGKTLLMRVKKNMLQSDREGVILIPSNDLELDEPRAMRALPRVSIMDTSMWANIWIASIMLSVASNAMKNFPDRTQKSKIERSIFQLQLDESVKKDINESVKLARGELPSYYLDTILSCNSDRKIIHFAQNLGTLVDSLSSIVSSAIYIFIDSVDFALENMFPGNMEMWKNAQQGLAKAAHRVFTINHHIKVFVTMREEAWAGFVDSDREVIKSSAIVISYDNNELLEIFQRASKLYARKKSLSEFIGLQEIRNLHCNTSENLFDYILRHSIGTPRSLMYFGKRIQEASLLKINPIEEREKKFRAVIDSVAQENIYNDYLQGQKRIFLSTLDSIDKIENFVKLIPSNVMPYSALRAITNEFIGKHSLDGEAHPFCELRNIGLLGRVKTASANKGEEQHFQHPSEFDWNRKRILLDGGIYLLHPGLTSYIVNKRIRFHINGSNVIGNGLRWYRSEDEHGLERCGIPWIFISYSSIDKDWVEGIVSKLAPKIYLRFPSLIWLDNWVIMGGDYFHPEIERGATGSDVMVLFASESSLKSTWVEREWRLKHKQELDGKDTRLIVATKDSRIKEKLPTFLKEKQAVMLYPDDERGIDHLAASICDQLEKRYECATEVNGADATPTANAAA
jgi:hypothetical protein